MPRGRKFYEPFLQDETGNLHHPHTNEIVGRIEEPTAAVDEQLPGPRAFVIEQTGMYLLVDDVVVILRTLADKYDDAANPSAALALREVADAWTQ